MKEKVFKKGDWVEFTIDYLLTVQARVEKVGPDYCVVKIGDNTEIIKHHSLTKINTFSVKDKVITPDGFEGIVTDVNHMNIYKVCYNTIQEYGEDDLTLNPNNAQNSEEVFKTLADETSVIKSLEQEEILLHPTFNTVEDVTNFIELYKKLSLLHYHRNDLVRGKWYSKRAIEISKKMIPIRN